MERLRLSWLLAHLPPTFVWAAYVGGVCLPVPGQNAIRVKRDLLLMSGAVLEGCASPKFHLAENGLT
jgi:hypothetical protein